MTFKIFCYNAGDNQNILLSLVNCLSQLEKVVPDIFDLKCEIQILKSPEYDHNVIEIHEYVCYSCESEGKLEQGVPFMLNVISVGVQHKILTWNDEAAGVIMEF